MYGACLFCNTKLGANEVIEHFPVGRKLAFDAAKGRLWVVCPRCTRWNLTPLEERWEAIEECERIFRDTRLRVSTDNIGLAKLKEGLELVRIGQPQRGEFAAWRYGGVFARRRRQAIRHGALAVGLGATFAAITGTAIALPALVGYGAYLFMQRGDDDLLLHLPNPEGGYITLWRAQLTEAILRPRPDTPERWALELPHAGVVERPRSHWRLSFGSKKVAGRVTLTGAEAVRAAGLVLARTNTEGAKPQVVQDAVRTLEQGGGPERYFDTLLGGPHALPSSLVSYGEPIRVALEMAANEENERRAMEGELAGLEEAWKQAEEIAAIADTMLLPQGVSEAFDRLRAPRGR